MPLLLRGGSQQFRGAAEAEAAAAAAALTVAAAAAWAAAAVAAAIWSLGTALFTSTGFSWRQCIAPIFFFFSERKR